MQVISISTEMRKSRLLVRVLTLVFSSLLAIVDGSFSSVLHLKLQPERPNNLYYSLRGSRFVLNCTAVVRNYTQALNLTWQHNKKWLFGEVQHIDTATVQLTLSSTSSANNGIYWCGPKFGHMSQGVNISLIVADPPSSPRNLRYSVVGAMHIDREYRLFWSASSVTGGLPVNYSVKLCMNDSYASNNGVCKLNSNPDCLSTNVLSKDKDFFCVLHKSGDFISPCEKTCDYTVSVVAENAVGSATSWRYLPFIPWYSVTPLPPLSFNVETTGQQKELRVSWTARALWKKTVMEYTILYHARKEMENKTEVIPIKHGSTDFFLLKQLKSFVEYYVYLKVKFVNNEGKSASSGVEGPIIVKTPAGEPDAPPKVIRDWSAIFPDNPALRNVTVEWKLAHNSSWHGTPGKHVVSCRHRYVSQGPLPDCEYQVDATSNRAVLQRLDSAKSYNVFIKICNKEQFCRRTVGEPYVVKKLQDKTTPPQNGRKLSSKQIALITVSVVVGCMTALVAVYLLRLWLRRNGVSPRIPLTNLFTLQPPPPPYNYMDPPATSDYDQLNLNENRL